MHPEDIYSFKVNNGNIRTMKVTYAAIWSYKPSISDKSHSFKMSAVKKYALEKMTTKINFCAWKTHKRTIAQKSFTYDATIKLFIYIKISLKHYRFSFSQTNFQLNTTKWTSECAKIKSHKSMPDLFY